jgi:nitroreductase
MTLDCLKLLASRQSIRKFTDAPVSAEVIDDIIKMALQAPSAGNRQPWRIVVVHDRDRLEQLSKAAFGQQFVASCQVLLGIFAVPDESAERYADRGRNLYVFQDTAALTYALLLGIHFHGLGGCWVGAFDDDAVAQVFNAPEGFRPVAMVPIGHYETPPPPRPRRGVSEVVLRETF